MTHTPPPHAALHWLRVRYVCPLVEQVYRQVPVSSGSAVGCALPEVTWEANMPTVIKVAMIHFFMTARMAPGDAFAQRGSCGHPKSGAPTCAPLYNKRAMVRSIAEPTARSGPGHLRSLGTGTWHTPSGVQRPVRRSRFLANSVYASSSTCEMPGTRVTATTRRQPMAL